VAEPVLEAETVRSTGWSNPFKLHRYGERLPYVWGGMGLGAWLRFMASGRFDITLNCLPRILAVTLVSPLNSALGGASRAIYGRRVAQTKIIPPIFILGHWRTGTSLLHELLGADPRHSFPTTYECVFPTTFLLTNRLAGRLGKLLLPAKRPFDDMPAGAERPMEDEMAFPALGMNTPYSSFAFPRHGLRDMDYAELTGLPEEKRAAWERRFLGFVQSLQYAHGKRLVLKSPIHTARIPTLIKLFPEARFVHTARNPFDVFPSMINTWKIMAFSQGLHNPPPSGDFWRDNVIEILARLFADYERDRHLIPEGQLTEIRYEDLVADPPGTLRQIYARLDLGDFEAARPAVAHYLEGRRGHKRNRFPLSDHDRRLIADRWQPYFERFRYATTAAAG
jgi:omega-hydroxy-beta-dihydromenaquinone-9 sulfotransferase